MNGDCFILSCRHNGAYVNTKNISFSEADIKIMNGLDESVGDTNINDLFITDWVSFPFSWISDGKTNMCLKRTGKRVLIWRD